MAKNTLKNPTLILCTWILCSCVSAPSASTKQFSYQYTLKTSKDGVSFDVAPNTPYYLAIINHPEISDKSKQDGITDKDGKTRIIFSDFPIKESDVTLTERYGDGSFGETFQLLLPSDDPWQKLDYIISIKCPNKKEQTTGGFTSEQGYTKYVATNQACELKVSPNFYETLPVQEE